MLLERTELLINEGQEVDFAAAMQAEGIAMLAAVPGVMRRRPCLYIDRMSLIRR